MIGFPPRTKLRRFIATGRCDMTAQSNRDVHYRYQTACHNGLSDDMAYERAFTQANQAYSIASQIHLITPVYDP